MKQIAACLSIVAALGCASVGRPPAAEAAEEPTVAGDVAARLARYAASELRADLADPSDDERRVLGVPVDIRPLYPQATELAPPG